MNAIGRPAAAVLGTVVLLSCAVVPTKQPTDPVRRALAAMVAHDLDTARSYVCTERRGHVTLPFIVSGLMAPVDGLEFEAGYTLITFDATRLVVTEARRDAEQAWIAISGVLSERVDPGRYEAAYRSAVTARGEPVDEALLGGVLRLIGDGEVDLPVDELVRVIRENGTWAICEVAPTL